MLRDFFILPKIALLYFTMAFDRLINNSNPNGSYDILANFTLQEPTVILLSANH